MNYISYMKSRLSGLNKTLAEGKKTKNKKLISEAVRSWQTDSDVCSIFALWESFQRQDLSLESAEQYISEGIKRATSIKFNTPSTPTFSKYENTYDDDLNILLFESKNPKMFKRWFDAKTNVLKHLTQDEAKTRQVKEMAKALDESAKSLSEYEKNILQSLLKEDTKSFYQERKKEALTLLNETLKTNQKVEEQNVVLSIKADLLEDEGRTIQENISKVLNVLKVLNKS